LNHGFDIPYSYRPLHEKLGHAFANTVLFLDWDRRGFPYPLVPFTTNAYGRYLTASNGVPPTPSAAAKFAGHEDPPGPQPWRCFQIGAATIDPKRFELKRGKAVAELTAKELRLLQLFNSHPGEVLSRDRLLNEVWGYNYYGTTRTLDQVIVQLRKKLGDNGNEPKHLVTVHGVGYKLVP
jgi:hypothetical protein